MAAASPVTPDALWEHQRVAQYIFTHGFSRVTLQFPDELLSHAPTIARQLQLLLQQQGSAAKVCWTVNVLATVVITVISLEAHKQWAAPP